MTSSKMKTLPEVVALFKQSDHLAVPLATGQPMTLLNALNDRQDWKELHIFSGLSTFPYPILTNPNVHVTSGYYGPIERFLNEQGTHMEYLPLDFRGFETYALKNPYRIVATTLSPPDDEGYLTFGTHGAAIYKPFIQACHNKNQIAIGEINKKMPVVYGDKTHGDNKIHIDDIDVLFEADYTQSEVPDLPTSDIEVKIADNVLSLIENKSTLQFGIGAIPDLIAGKLVASNMKDFGIHSELISDGFLKLMESGKISNKFKRVFDNQSVFTFAFGRKSLYEWLDERNGKNNRQTICLPVSVVNDPAVIRNLGKFISINSGLMIDFSGQICSEAIGHRQYSGVGGQLSFVMGSVENLEGKSIICIKSTAKIGDKTISNIMPELPPGSIISTPRHFVNYIVTEYGVANLYGVSDEKRAEKLIAIAHPDFRDELAQKFKHIKQTFYH